MRQRKKGKIHATMLSAFFFCEPLSFLANRYLLMGTAIFFCEALPFFAKRFLFSRSAMFFREARCFLRSATFRVLIVKYNAQLTVSNDCAEGNLNECFSLWSFDVKKIEIYKIQYIGIINSVIRFLVWNICPK